MLRPTLQHFYPNFPLISGKLRWKTSLLVRSKILGLFGNTLIADHIYFCHRCQKFLQGVQTLLSQQSNKFWENFMQILQSQQDFAHFGKTLFWNTLSPRNVVIPMLERYSFRIPFQSQSVHGSKTVLKPPLQHFYRNFPLIYDKLSSKISFLDRSKNLGVFRNALTADHMYSRHR